MARRIGVVTTARSDYGVLMPLLRDLRCREGVELKIFAGGTHFAAVNGYSIAEVEREFPDCTIPIPCQILGDGPQDLALAMAEILAGFARALFQHRPDILVVLGDRYDMLPAVLAATPYNIPIAHLSGGEVTEGVIDDAIRHAVTKLAHLHYPTNEEYGRRLKQLGEEEFRIIIAGEPGLDLFRDMSVKNKKEVFDEYELDPSRPVSILTYHPETIGYENVSKHIKEVLAAADLMVDTQVLFTHPNSDTGSSHIVRAIHEFAKDKKDCRVVPSLGKQRYFQLLHHVDCLVGNSSSGIIEAASVLLPAVNIGNRQKGRIAPRNVINVPIDRKAIYDAWRQAISPCFRKCLVGLVNPYGDGRSAPKIGEHLETVEISDNLIRKRFIDHSPEK